MSNHSTNDRFGNHCNQNHIEEWQRHESRITWNQFSRDGDISWKMTPPGNFFLKWATSRGYLERVTSHGHSLVTSHGNFCPQEVLFLGEFSWTFFG